MKSDLMAYEISWLLREVRLAWYNINASQVSAGEFKSFNQEGMRIKSHNATQLPPFLQHPLPQSPFEFDWGKIRSARSAGSLISLLPSLQSRPFYSPRLWLTLKMPRRRVVSRRGGSSAPRGRATPSQPQNVIPITFASPPSPPPSQAYHLPNNSFQSTRFTFHNRLNRPVLTTSITIILAEEEEHHSEPVISSSSQSQEESSAQRGLGGVVFTADNMQEDSSAPEFSTQQRNSSQNDDLECELVHHDFGILHLVTPTECGADGIDEAGFITWVASPSKPTEQDTHSPTQDE